ncbi:ATP-binding cassette domain-containing protein [Brevibacterium sp. UMB10442]|nr:ATP-binding cassette domain-containing protein [Brevibacterium sp. UMB10442]
MNAITLENISKSYKGSPLYENASAEIPEGQITAIAGPNGSGKSVLLRMMCGLVRPDHGTVIFTSHNAEDIDLLAEHIYHVEGGALVYEQGQARTRS